MKILIIKSLLGSLLVLLTGLPAFADYVECKDLKGTELNFYNNYGRISFALGATHKDEYLYLIGNCYSENEDGIGIPYSCEVAPGVEDVVRIRFFENDQSLEFAQLDYSFPDGSTSREIIACEYIP